MLWITKGWYTGRSYNIGPNNWSTQILAHEGTLGQTPKKKKTKRVRNHRWKCVPDSASPESSQAEDWTRVWQCEEKAIPKHKIFSVTGKS